MSLNIHIATLGHDPKTNKGNKGPIVDGTFQNYSNIDKLYLLCSEVSDVDEIREDLKIFKKLKIQHVKIDKDDFSDIIGKIIEIHAKETKTISDVKFFVNVTGGTKIMSCGALVGANYIGALTYYVSIDDEKAIELNPPLVPPSDLVEKQQKIVQLVTKKDMYQSHIAEKLNISVQLVSYNCKRLKKYGYIEIIQDPKDRRATLIHITPMGKMALRAFR